MNVSSVKKRISLLGVWKGKGVEDIKNLEKEIRRKKPAFLVQNTRSNGSYGHKTNEWE